MFYPGPSPLRASPAALTFVGSAPLTGAPAAQQPSQLLDEYAQALGRQPWLREWPATLGQVQLAQQPAGSGMRYASGPNELRGKGRDITWAVDGRIPTNCIAQGR